MDRKHQSRPNRPHRLLAGVALGALSAGCLALVACDRPPPQRSRADRPAEPAYEPYVQSPAGESPAPAQNLAATGPSSGSPQPRIPLPPGWAEQYPPETPQDRVTASTTPDSFSGWEQSRGGTTSDGQVGYERADAGEPAPGGSYGPADPGQPGPGAGADDRSGRRSAMPPSPRTDYTVMVVVFLAPLAVLVPLLWIWHLLRTASPFARRAR